MYCNFCLFYTSLLFFEKLFNFFKITDKTSHRRKVLFLCFKPETQEQNFLATEKV